MDSNLSLENVQERIVIVRSLFREKERKGEKLSYNSRDRRGEILESGGESRNRLRFPMPPTG